MRSFSILSILLAAASISLSARADTLNLPGGRPDVETTDLNVSYDGANFSVTNQGQGFDFFTLADSSNNSHDIVGNYTISAVIDNTGALSGNSNTVQIFGAVLDGYDNTDPSDITALILSGDLTKVGFPSSDPHATSGNVIDFTFNVTGGELANIWGLTGGIILTVDQTATPSFAAPFQSNEGGNSFADNFATQVVPTPNAVWGGSALLGAMGLLAVARNRLSRSEANV